MIPKIVTGDNIDGLMAYLQKPGHTIISPRGIAPAEFVDQVKMVADLSARCTKPIKHLSFSAAESDGRLPDEVWLQLVDEVEAELGLSGHLRIVVRHSDTKYDHVHPVWCAVSEETGKTPPKRWFREPHTEYLPELGPLALTNEQVELVPANQRKLKSYDAHALTRLQHLCRRFEQRHNLRELASPSAPTVTSGKRSARNNRAQKHRRERLGDTLLDQADEIRIALDVSSYAERAAKLHAIGLGIRPATARTKSGEERLRGILIFDLANPANAIAASNLDLGGIKYGMGALDKRTDADSPRYEEWTRTYVPPVPPIDNIEREAIRRRYQKLRADHKKAEMAKADERRQLRQRHAAEQKALRATLMKQRYQHVQTLPRAQRRSYYAVFDEDVRAPAMRMMREQHVAELAQYKRSRLPAFAPWRRRQMLAIVHKIDFGSPRFPDAARAGLLRHIGGFQSIPSLQAKRKKPTSTPEPQQPTLETPVHQDQLPTPARPRPKEKGPSSTIKTLREIIKNSQNRRDTSLERVGETVRESTSDPKPKSTPAHAADQSQHRGDTPAVPAQRSVPPASRPSPASPTGSKQTPAAPTAADVANARIEAARRMRALTKGPSIAEPPINIRTLRDRDKGR